MLKETNSTNIEPRGIVSASDGDKCYCDGDNQTAFRNVIFKILYQTKINGYTLQLKIKIYA